MLLFATLGPLVLTNELWFRSLDRIGPARATLAANLQPFLASAIAVVLLGETLGPFEILGGMLIAAGILVGAAPRRARGSRRVAFAHVSPLRRTALASVVAAVALIAIKLVTGLAAGSLGFIAEAAHSGTDLVAALLTFFAVGVATKPADEAHLYGHGKAEHLAALAEAAFLVLVSFVVAGLAVARLAGWIDVDVEPAWWAFAAAAVVIVIDLSRTVVSYRTARRHSSAALLSNAVHFGADLLGTIAVLGGLLAARAGFPEGDSIAALFVAVPRRPRGCPADPAQRRRADGPRARRRGRGSPRGDPPTRPARRPATAAAPPGGWTDVRRRRDRRVARRRGRPGARDCRPGRGRRAARPAGQRRRRPRRADGPRGRAPGTHPRRGDDGPARQGAPRPAADRHRRRARGVAPPEAARRPRLSRPHTRSPSRSRRRSAEPCPRCTRCRPTSSRSPSGRPGRIRAHDPAGIEQAIVRVTGGPPRALRTLETPDGLVVLVTLALDGSTTVADAHRQASAVSRGIREALPDVADVVVHTEP